MKFLANSGVLNIVSLKMVIILPDYEQIQKTGRDL